MTNRWEDYAVRKAMVIRVEVDAAKHMADLVYNHDEFITVHIEFEGFQMNVWLSNPENPNQIVRI